MISLVITNYNSASYIEQTIDSIINDKSKADSYQSFVYTDYLSREDIVNERYKLETVLRG